MTSLFSDETRRNPYPLYDQMRKGCPVHYVPPPFDAWMIFDYQNVKWVLNDNARFSSRVPAPPDWFVFFDPPAHTKLRALISRAFTPRVIAALEPRIRALSRQLLSETAQRGEMDLAADYSVPLPMMVISEIIGIPAVDGPRFRRWSDVILNLSYSRSGGAEAATAISDFRAVTAEMNSCLGEMIQQRRASPADDLLTRLIEAETDGEHLTQKEILGFFQLLIVAGQETNTNLINNAILCLMEHPEQREHLERRIDLLPSAIEEVLRFRSPVQWMMRTTREDIQVNGTTIPAGKLVLPMIGSANRDPGQFRDPDCFDITRASNPHVAFGHGIHFCLGAYLSRLEARIALTDLLERVRGFELASDEPWTPRKALHVHGPASLPLRFQSSRG